MARIPLDLPLFLSTFKFYLKSSTYPLRGRFGRSRPLNMKAISGIEVQPFKRDPWKIA
jgi:hypothetical protein